MQSIWTPEVLIHGAQFIALTVGGWIGLKIRAEAAERETRQIQQQAEVKEELVASQHEMRRDMDAKHAENKQTIAVHTASDEKQFANIAESLVRIEKKL